MYDIIIRNGSVIDGTGAREFPGDIGIKEGIIAAIGNLRNDPSENIIDARGCYVAPGFVDIDNHSDTRWQIFLDPNLESLVRQGITTIVGGNCGSSLAPLSDQSLLQSIQKWTDTRALNLNWLSTKEFLDEVERCELSVNFATLSGHGTLRRGFVRDESRPLRSAELAGMQKMLEQSMREGSLGMSLGLAYAHGRHATEHELSALAKAVGKRSGFCSAHIRDEGKSLSESVSEIVGIAKRSGARMHISHLKSVGKRNWGLMSRALAMLDSSDAEGADLSFDIYPYRSTATVLYTILPAWITNGGKKMMFERLRNPSIRAEAAKDLCEENIDYSSATLSVPSLSKMMNRTNVLDMARAEGKSPEEVIFDVLLASDDRATVSLDAISEEDIEQGLRHPFSIVSTNGSGYSDEYSETGESVHPRCFGAFPRVLSRYVRERKLLGWEEAIHKMTGKPAARAGIRNRGTIAVGNHADIVVIQPNEVEDHATTENPFRYPSGIPFVIVNGAVAVDDGKCTGSRSGSVLRRKPGFFERFW